MPAVPIRAVSFPGTLFTVRVHVTRNVFVKHAASATHRHIFNNAENENGSGMRDLLSSAVLVHVMFCGTGGQSDFRTLSSARLRRSAVRVITNAINAKNGGLCSMCVCVVGVVSKSERIKKKCCLAKGVDVIKTAATNCSFVLRGGVNFGRVFSVSLTHTHTHVCCTRLEHNGPRGRYTGVTRRRKEAARGPPG